MINWLIIDWVLMDDWLMIDWWLIDDGLVDGWLIIDWWLIDDSWNGFITVLTVSRSVVYSTLYILVLLSNQQPYTPLTPVYGCRHNVHLLSSSHFWVVQGYNQLFFKVFFLPLLGIVPSNEISFVYLFSFLSVTLFDKVVYSTLINKVSFVQPTNFHLPPHLSMAAGVYVHPLPLLFNHSKPSPSWSWSNRSATSTVRPLQCHVILQSSKN